MSTKIVHVTPKTAAVAASTAAVTATTIEQTTATTTACSRREKASFVQRHLQIMTNI